MTSRLVFTVPDAAYGVKVVEALQGMGVDESQLSVVGKQTDVVETLPEQGEFENDVKPAAARGAVVGGAIGLLGGLAAVAAAPGLAVAGAAVALATAGGASFGVLSSSLIGASVPNSQLREYEEAIERGEVLIVVEAEDGEIARLSRNLHEQFPRLNLEGELSSMPVL